MTGQVENKGDEPAGFSEFNEICSDSFDCPKYFLLHLKIKKPINEPTIPPDSAMPKVASKLYEFACKILGEMGIIEEEGEDVKEDIEVEEYVDVVDAVHMTDVEDVDVVVPVEDAVEEVVADTVRDVVGEIEAITERNTAIWPDCKIPAVGPPTRTIPSF